VTIRAGIEEVKFHNNGTVSLIIYGIKSEMHPIMT